MGDEQRDRPECRECRETVSARLDGEAGQAEVVRAEAHLAGCAPCREIAERAARVTRLARMAPVVPCPDLVDAVAAALDGADQGADHRADQSADHRADQPADRPASARGAERTRRRLTDLVRLGLGGAAAGQVALVVSGVVAVGQARHGAGQLAGASAAHLVHESSAWNLALGVAFAVAAARTRPAGTLPVVGAFVGLLGLFSVVDVLLGRVDPGRLVGHVVVLAGFLLLLVLWRLDRGGPGESRRRDGVRGEASDVARPASPGRDRRRPYVAPAGRRAV